MAKPRQWPPPGRLRDDRLVYYAAEPTMLRWARPWWGVIGGVALSGGRRRRISKRMRRYVIACAELVPRLEPEEMAIVRVSGRLPEWFFPALRRQSRPWRRRNR